MAGLLMNNKLERMWNEALFQDIPEKTEGSLRKPSVRIAGVLAEIRT
jgi:hypothetical protein